MDISLKSLCKGLIMGKYRFSSVNIDGRYIDGVVDNASNTVIFSLKGAKDYVLIGQVFTCIQNYFSLNKSKNYDMQDELNEIYFELDSYMPYSIAMVAAVEGMVTEFKDDFNFKDERTKECLISCDCNSPKKARFHIKWSKKSPIIVGIQTNNLINEFGRVWEFVYNIKGQSRLKFTYTLKDLQREFTDFEIMYLLFLLQFSSKSWVKGVLEEIVK